jgi:hypothetical protein
MSAELRDAVERVFVHSFVEDRARPPEVVDVRRVGNPDLLPLYVAARDALATRSHPRIRAQTQSDVLERELGLLPEVNELMLFHGTSGSNAEAIAREGFALDKSRSSGIFGKGIYLADYAFKASNYGTYGSGGILTVLLCRVLMGTPKKFMHNAHGLRAVPEFRERNFDSVLGVHPKQVGVGGMGMNASGRAPLREFVLFDAKKVYPEFIITYKS